MTSAASGPSLLIATRKGLWVLDGNPDRTAWTLVGPQFLGHIVHHAVLDPRDGKTLLVAARTGHLGHAVMRSTDRGRTWTESKQPPVFDPAHDARSVDHVFWLTPGHSNEPGVWYAVYRTDDGGTTWRRQDNRFPREQAWWTVKRQAMTTDGCVESERLGLYFGTTSGEIWGSDDEGESWQCLARSLPHIYAVEAAAFHNPNYGQGPICRRL